MLLAEESHHRIHHGNLTAHQALCLLWFKMIVWSQVLHSIYPLDDLVFLLHNYHHNQHDLREGFKYHIVFETFPNGPCRHCLILTINSSFLVCKSKREKFFSPLSLRNTWTEVFGDQVALSEQTLFGSFGTYLGYHSREGELLDGSRNWIWFIRLHPTILWMFSSKQVIQYTQKMFIQI